MGCISLLELHNPTLQTEWLKQQKCIVSRFWRLEGQGEASAGLVSSEGLAGGSVPGLSYNFWWFAGLLWHYLACRCVTLISAFTFRWCSPGVSVSSQGVLTCGRRPVTVN